MYLISHSIDQSLISDLNSTYTELAIWITETNSTTLHLEAYTRLKVVEVEVTVTDGEVQVVLVLGKLEQQKMSFGWLVDVSTCVKTCSNSASS